MKVWLIKHQGKNWLGNMMCAFEVKVDEKTVAYAQECFYRKKDAVAYLKHYNNEYLEVVSATLEESKQDNRKR